jgi:DUF1680 family protein
MTFTATPLKVYHIPLLSVAAMLCVAGIAQRVGNRSDQSVGLRTGLTVKQIREVSFRQVQINDHFWKPSIEKSRLVGIRAAIQEAAGDLENFDIAAGKKKGKHRGGVGSDSNIFKIIEGAANALANVPDKNLEATIDSLVDRVVAAQQPDGYLFTYYIINDLSKRWTDVPRKHELYCLGHMIEAGLAYYKTTGKRKLLDAAIRYTDYVETVFGPGKRYEAPGHEEIELALYKLYKETGNRKYLSLCKFFLDERGNPERMTAEKISPPDKDPNANTPNRWRPPSYMQDHLPVTKQMYAVGHAVRATYLYSAMADISIEEKTQKYFPALQAIWNDIAGRKIYITGGIGTRQFHDEGFGSAYLLPDDQAYAETCSGIGLVFWNRRMNRLTGQVKYADMAELAMYNTVLSGIGIDGDRYFYTNPLQSDGRIKRNNWENPPCCPTNLIRFLPEVGSSIYAQTDEDIYVNQFIGNTAKIILKQKEVSVSMKTEYPWNGRMEMAVDPVAPVDFSVRIRIPGWSVGELLPGGLYQYLKNEKRDPDSIVISVNGNKIIKPLVENGYMIIRRKWKKGDKIVLNLPMPVRLVSADKRLESAQRKLAIMRGPMVYCLEETDNNLFFEKTSHQFSLDSFAQVRFQNNLLGGIMTMNLMVTDQEDKKSSTLKVIPYYAWCNREQGRMKVWLPVQLAGK